MTEYHDHRDDCPFKFATLDMCDCVEKNMLDRIEALTEQLAAARQDAKAAEDELEMQEQEACMMENDYIKLEEERDALEAKLAKAVGALEVLSDYENLDKSGGYYDGECRIFSYQALQRYGDFDDVARTALAQIKGESYE